MLNYDEFNRLIREEVKKLQPNPVDDDDDESHVIVIYQSNALNVQKGVAFDGAKFYVVTYESGVTRTDSYSKDLI